MTRKCAGEMLALMMAAYPAAFQGFDTAKAAQTVDLWMAQFDGEPDEHVQKAVNNLIGKMKFAPSIAEIKLELERLMPEVAAPKPSGSHKLTAQQYQWAAQMYGGKLTASEEDEFWHWFNDPARPEMLKGAKL